MAKSSRKERKVSRDVELKLLDEVSKYYSDPVGWVLMAF